MRGNSWGSGDSVLAHPSEVAPDGVRQQGRGCESAPFATLALFPLFRAFTLTFVPVRDHDRSVHYRWQTNFTFFRSASIMSSAMATATCANVMS